MYEKILVPLDGSELAEVAIPYTEELAGALNSEIIMLLVSESEEDKLYHIHQSYIEKMVDDARQRARRRRRKSARVESVHLVGHAAEQIVDYADREKIGMIVMATHGRSGIRRWFVGEVASKVVRATDRPVALIRAKDATSIGSKKRLLRRVLVPLDGSKTSEAIIPDISGLALKLRTEVVLYWVVAYAHFIYAIPGDVVEKPLSPKEMEKLIAKANEYLETVSAKLKDKGINVRYEVGFGHAAEQIISFADEIRADLVAMSTHGHSGVSRWALGSTTDKVIHAGNTPVLIVR